MYVPPRSLVNENPSTPGETARSKTITRKVCCAVGATAASTAIGHMNLPASRTKRNEPLKLSCPESLHVPKLKQAAEVMCAVSARERRR
jgi:hypothetical protein